MQIGARPGAKFSAFGGALSGRILQTVPGRLIVQSWRAKPFHKGDHDSTLILRFLPAGKNRGRIDLVHINVPAHDYWGVEKGWKNFYWKPWRRRSQPTSLSTIRKSSRFGFARASPMFPSRVP